MKEFLESPVHEFMESPLHERLHSVAPPRLSMQILYQRKVWGGIRPFKVDGDLNGSWTTALGNYERSVAIRKRYGTKTTQYAGVDRDNNATAYSEVSTLEGIGKAPQVSGGVASWGYDDFGPTYIPSGTSSKYNPGASSPEVMMINTRAATERSWIANPDYLLGDPHALSLVETLSGEIPFAPELVTLSTRLKARAWDEFDTWDQVDRNRLEYYDEYRTALDTFSFNGLNCYVNCDPVAPATFSDTWIDGYSGTDEISQIWIDNPEILSRPGSSYQPLASFWLYPEWNDQYVASVTGNSKGEFRIDARRFRFKINNAVSTAYFLARGLLYATYNDTTGQAGVKLFPVVSVFKSGTLGSGDILEVDLPHIPSDEKTTWTDFSRVGDKLSCGCIAFAILNETPKAWSERTEIDIVGTADSDIISADSDFVTLDMEP